MKVVNITQVFLKYTCFFLRSGDISKERANDPRLVASSARSSGVRPL